MAWYLLGLCAACKLLNVFFAALAWWFYRRKQSKDFGLERLQDDPLPTGRDSPAATAEFFNAALARPLREEASCGKGEVNVGYEDPDEDSERRSRTAERLTANV